MNASMPATVWYGKINRQTFRCFPSFQLGEPPWLSIIASELTFVANTLREGSLRTGIKVVGQVLDRAQVLSGK
jgi:hypothetical protein